LVKVAEKGIISIHPEKGHLNGGNCGLHTAAIRKQFA